MSLLAKNIILVNVAKMLYPLYIVKHFRQQTRALQIQRKMVLIKSFFYPYADTVVFIVVTLAV